MPNVKMKGIILSENNMGDFDKMLTILTPGVGKISCVAKGARRSKSALLAGTQLFCFGEYLMYKGTTTYHINSCDIIEMFYNLRCDLDKLGYAIKINKIVQEVTTENENCFLILQLYLNSLYTIAQTDLDLEFILNIFKLRLMSIIGFEPRIEKCVKCNKKEEEELKYFSIQDKGFKCTTCARTDKSVIQISIGTLKAIKYTILVPAKKLYSFTLKDEALREYCLISKVFFNDNIDGI